MRPLLNVRHPLAAGVFGVALALMACRREDAGGPLPDNVAAVVEGTIISPEALLQEVLKLGYTNGWDEAIESCLEELIRAEAVFVKATEEGFDKSPQVQAAIRSNQPSGMLADSSEAMRPATAKEVVVARFLETHLGLDPSQVQISDAEIQAYFRKNPNEFTTLPLANAVMIFVRAPAGSPPEDLAAAKTRAESIRARALQQPELREFEALARQHSDHPATRNTGGNLGWLQQDATNQWPEALIQALFALREPGEISSLVATPDGFYVLRLIKRRPASVVQWEEARERIRSKLAEKKEAARAEQYFASLKARLRIQINRARLEALKEQLKTNPPRRGN